MKKSWPACVVNATPKGGVPGRRGAGVINGVSGFGQISKIAARTGDVIGTLIQFRHLPVPGLALSAKDMAALTDYLKSIAPGG